MSMIRKADIEDVDDIIHLIELRMQWMDQKGLEHWNKHNYLEIYPRSYFIENIEHFYVAFQNDRMTGAICLYTTDPRWKDGRYAYYIHHLVADTTQKGVGKELIEYTFDLAKKENIDCVRLDYDVDCIPLKK